MSNNFDLRKFLSENKLTTTAKLLKEGTMSLNQAQVDLLMDKSKYATKDGNETGVYIVYDLSIEKGASSFGDDMATQKVGVLWTPESRRKAYQFDSDSEETNKKLLALAKTNEGEAIVNEMNGGYIEVMGDEFDEATDQLAQVWQRWKNGPATEDEDIEPAKEDILQYIKAVILK